MIRLIGIDWKEKMKKHFVLKIKDCWNLSCSGYQTIRCVSISPIRSLKLLKECSFTSLMESRMQKANSTSVDSK